MELRDKVIVVTGGANGIGRALAERFAREEPRGITVVDLVEADARAVSDPFGDRGLGIGADVSNEDEVVRLIEATEDRWGPVDLFCSNAGIGGPPGGVDTPNEGWQQIWDVNVMAHLYAARALIPGMIARGEGYLLNTASAAGLLTNLGAAAYSVTKHAAVGLAEWLSITYGDQGVKVSCLCPQGVRTDMLLGGAGDLAGEVVLAQGAIEPAECAEAVVAGLAEESFLILPHPEVIDYFQRKAGDYDRWIGGMRKLQRRINEATQA